MMHPQIRFLNYTFSSYLIMFLLGVVISCVLGMTVFRRKDVQMFPGVYCIAFAYAFGIIGAKLLYVLEEVSYYLKHPGQLLVPSNMGMVFYGGILGGAAGVYLFSKLYKAPFWNYMDNIAFCLPTAQAIGRIGCLMAGCCYGRPTKLPWGIRYPEGAIGISEPVHPVQLYEAFSNIILLAFLIFSDRKSRRAGWFTGVYLVWNSLMRIIFEFFRGDINEGGGFVTDSQIVAILLFCSGVFILKRHKKIRN